LTIQFAVGFSASNSWLSLTNYTLLSNSALVLDPTPPLTTQRVYRVIISVPTNMIWIPAGNFVMGSPTNEVQRGPSSETQHFVALTKGFYLSGYLVTQGNYLSLIGANPSYYTPANAFTADLSRPVEQVSWSDATNYCAMLTSNERAAGHIFANWVYRLPTEAEWEYCCRAGTTTTFYYGNDLRSGMANFDGNYEYTGGVGTVFNTNGIFLDRTSAVGGYQPNAWGLYDMAGNVWEWCQDWYGTYPAIGVVDPAGPSSGTARVFRGGSLNATANRCRSANRDSYDPTSGFNTLGFRVVLSVGP
jgi:formylglycine-generating enzyme required for sulfatase activity